MRRVGDVGVHSLFGAGFDRPTWLAEDERGSLVADTEVVLNDSGNLSLLELKAGAVIQLDGNLLVVIDLARGGGIGGGTDSSAFVCEVRSCFLDRTIVNGCGVRSMLPVLSLLAAFHSSSQAGIMWSTHSHS